MNFVLALWEKTFAGAFGNKKQIKRANANTLSLFGVRLQATGTFTETVTRQHLQFACLHTEKAFTPRYADAPEVFIRGKVFTHGSFYTATFTQQSVYTHVTQELSHRRPLTTRHIYTQELLHRKALTQKNFDTQTSLHA